MISPLLSPLWLPAVVMSINSLHLDLSYAPFYWFWICHFSIALNVTLFFCSNMEGRAPTLAHWLFYRYQRYPCRVVPNPSSLFYSRGSFSHPLHIIFPSPSPESLFLLSLMLCVWCLLCRASSHQARLHTQWFKALRPTVNFKLRTCWSAPLNRDQIIHVLKDKHLLKYFAEFRPKHTH